MSLIPENTAYVILINDDNTMTVTQKRRIVQRSKLVDDLWFLVLPEYNKYNMTDFTVVLEYLAPVSHRYRTDILVLGNDTYNGYLKYTLPIDTEITAEAGEVKFKISFLLVDLDENGKAIQRVRKITESTINVVPNSAWSDIIPDDALSALDQRIIKTDAQIKALSEISNSLYYAKADDLSYNEESSELQLLSCGQEIGKKVIINSSGAINKDGIPVVDFSDIVINDEDEENRDIEYDVVEF